MQRKLHRYGFPVERKIRALEIRTHASRIMQFQIVAPLESAPGGLFGLDRKTQVARGIAGRNGHIFAHAKELDAAEGHHRHCVLNCRAEGHGRDFPAAAKAHAAVFVAASGSAAGAAPASASCATSAITAVGARHCLSNDKRKP